MDVRIGVQHTMKEIEVELPADVDRDAVLAEVEAALADDDRVLRLTDKNGRDVVVPSSRIGYVEVSRKDSERRIGFGA